MTQPINNSESEKRFDEYWNKREDLWGCHDSCIEPAAKAVFLDQQKIIDKQAQEIKAGDTLIELYRGEISETIRANLWMHDDESLDLKIGDRLLIEGVMALKSQRDTLRSQLDKLLHAIKWVLNDMCYKPPEEVLWASERWSYKLKQALLSITEDLWETNEKIKK